MYYGGTEIQLGVIRLPVDGRSKPLSRQAAESEQRKVVSDLIRTNNQTRFYGIPVGPVKSSGRLSDRFWMFNGGLVYSDMGHPEYATPEVHNLSDVVYYELAGRRAVDYLLRLGRLNHPTHGVFANSTDYFGKTYAYHENYSCPQNPDNLVRFMWPFLITRQTFAGAGQILSADDKKRHPNSDWFSIAQRSLLTNTTGSERGPDVYVGEYSVFAKSNRHNDQLFHFTGGDATTMATTTKLKIGTTALVLRMMLDDWRPPVSFLITSRELAVKNLKAIALDGHFRWRYESDGYYCSALDIQRTYFDEALKKFFKDPDPDTRWTLNTWGMTLDALESNPLSADWLDWPNKYKVLSALKQKGWILQELLRVDLAFHAADPERSIYQLAGGYGADEAKIAHAMYNPPLNTRALGRSMGVRAIDACADRQVGLLNRVPTEISWNYVDLGLNGQRLILPLVDRTYFEEAERFKRALESKYPRT